jgi:hypothetical protein
MLRADFRPREGSIRAKALASRRAPSEPVHPVPSEIVALERE